MVYNTTPKMLLVTWELCCSLHHNPKMLPATWEFSASSLPLNDSLLEFYIPFLISAVYIHSHLVIQSRHGRRSQTRRSPAWFSFMSAFGSEATKETYKAVNGLVDYTVPPWNLDMSFDGSLR